MGPAYRACCRVYGRWGSAAEITRGQSHYVELQACGCYPQDWGRETLALYRKRPGGKAATSAPPGAFDRGV